MLQHVCAGKSVPWMWTQLRMRHGVALVRLTLVILIAGGITAVRQRVIETEGFEPFYVAARHRRCT